MKRSLDKTLTKLLWGNPRVIELLFIQTMIKVRTLGYFVGNLTKDTAVIKMCHNRGKEL